MQAYNTYIQYSICSLCTKKTNKHNIARWSQTDKDESGQWNPEGNVTVSALLAGTEGAETLNDSFKETQQALSLSAHVRSPPLPGLNVLWLCVQGGQCERSC